MPSRSLLLDDFSHLVLMGPPKARHDGRMVAFRSGRALMSDNSYDYRIWGYDTEEEKAVPLTGGPRDGNPSWEPGGNRFLFVRGSDDGDELLVWNGPEYPEYRVLKHENSIERAEWAFKDVGVALFVEGKKEEDVRTIREIPFWWNGKGWTYWSVSRLRGIDLNTGETWPISPPELHVRDFMPSPDGRSVAFLALKDRSRQLDVSLFISDVYGEDVREVGPGNWYLTHVSWRGDGRALALVGHDKRRGLVTNKHLYETPLDEWDPVDLSPMDRSLGNSLNSDVRGGMDTRPKWADGKWYFLVHEGTAVHLYGSDGDPTPVISGPLSIEGFDILRGRVFLTVMRVNEPAELYEASLAAGMGSLRKLTGFNEGFTSRAKLVSPEEFRFTASDGAEVEGFLYRPDGDPPYPTVLYVHGGPATAFGHAFMHELHLLRDRGYAVLAVNPRGSEGYGEDFRDIRGRYGERDYQDLMEAVDEAISRGIADPDRLAVMGGSYGGFMTNWIIGHTTKFRAAVTMRGISNWISEYGTTDIGFFFNPDQIGGHPWENFRTYWEKSPLAHVTNVRTPTLIIHSLNDYRCWLDQALQLFTALKVLGVETELVLFPEEDHDLSRKGKPKHRVERLERILRWLDDHLRLRG